jgi:hypothetical protein
VSLSGKKINHKGTRSIAQRNTKGNQTFHTFWVTSDYLLLKWNLSIDIMGKKLISSFFLLYLLQAISPVKYGLLSADSVHDSVTVKRCSDFRITGDGSSIQWNSAGWITLNVEGESETLLKTKTKVLYSGTGIYFLFNCEDKKLTSSMKADNLNLYDEDVVEVFLWPDENFPVYFEYELSPYNFELPIIVPNNRGDFLGWLPWHYEGERKTQHATTILREGNKSTGPVSGWIAEFYIPYKLLAPLISKPPETGEKWRANMYRIDYDNGILPYSWQKTEKTFHEYDKFGTIIFE